MKAKSAIKAKWYKTMRYKIKKKNQEKKIKRTKSIINIKWNKITRDEIEK